MLLIRDFSLMPQKKVYKLCFCTSEISLPSILHLFQIGFSQLQNEFRFFRLSSAIYKLSSTVGEFTLG